MDILIIANFTGNFDGKDNDRFTYLANMLADEGNEVEVITSSFDHAKKQAKESVVPKKVVLTYIDEPGYPRNVCVRRFLSHKKWGENVEKYLQVRRKPDVVYAAVPSLTAPLLAGEYCKANNIKFVIDIQDLWPEAYKMVFDIPVISDILFAPFKRRADKIYSLADCICAVSQTYVNRALQNSKLDKGYAVYIGTDLDVFDQNAKDNEITDKPADEVWLGYCGRLSESYDIPTVIKALELVKVYGIIPPKFIVMGDGARKSEFENLAKEKGIDAIFTGNLPYPRMCGMLSACDMVVNPIAGKSAASIINKHADYAACGKPVINTQESVEYRKLIDKHKMGINCRTESAIEVSQAIIRLMDLRERDEMGLNARECARESFNRSETYRELCSVCSSVNECEQNTIL